MVLRCFDRKGINLSSGMVPFLRPSAMNGINPASRTGLGFTSCFGASQSSVYVHPSSLTSKGLNWTALQTGKLRGHKPITGLQL